MSAQWSARDWKPAPLSTAPYLAYSYGKFPPMIRTAERQDFIAIASVLDEQYRRMLHIVAPEPMPMRLAPTTASPPPRRRSINIPRCGISEGHRGTVCPGPSGADGVELLHAIRNTSGGPQGDRPPRPALCQKTNAVEFARLLGTITVCAAFMWRGKRCRQIGRKSIGVWRPSAWSWRNEHPTYKSAQLSSSCPRGGLNKPNWLNGLWNGLCGIGQFQTAIGDRLRTLFQMPPHCLALLSQLDRGQDRPTPDVAIICAHWIMARWTGRPWRPGWCSRSSICVAAAS